MSYALLVRDVNVPTDTWTVTGEQDARLVASRMVTSGIEFHVEPLPDDQWQFTMKASEAAGARACFKCWQFFGPVKGDADYALWCDLPVDHKGRHNDRMRASYTVAYGFGR